jgi:hypothetical protein
MCGLNQVLAEDATPLTLHTEAAVKAMAKTVQVRTLMTHYQYSNSNYQDFHIVDELSCGEHKLIIRCCLLSTVC